LKAERNIGFSATNIPEPGNIPATGQNTHQEASRFRPSQIQKKSRWPGLLAKIVWPIIHPAYPGHITSDLPVRTSASAKMFQVKYFCPIGERNPSKADHLSRREQLFSCLARNRNQ
jgi:hypothetical protein